MKKKTRLLAMLLTVLMVVGILPLSLFALDSEPTGQSDGTYTARPLTEIQTEFDKQNVILGGFQDFETLSDEAFHNLKGNGYMTLGTAQNGVGDGNFTFNISDQITDATDASILGSAFSIREDGTNKALFLGNFSETEKSNGSFIQFAKNDEGVSDAYLSLDLKLNGEVAPVPNDYEDSGLFQFIYRTNGPSPVHVLYMNNKGEIYLDNSFSEEALIATLSSTEYTRISIVINRTANLFFVYINDVLANDGGTTFVPQAAIDKYNNYKTTNPSNTHGASLSANALPLEGCRFLITSVNGVGRSGEHDGLWIDNLTYGYKFPLKEGSSTNTVYAYSDFTGFAAGTNVATATGGELNNNKINGIIAQNGANIQGSLSYAGIKFVDEDGDPTTAESIGWGTGSGKDGQGYFDVALGSKFEAISFSMKVRQGADGVIATGDFLRVQDYSQGRRRETSLLKLAADGTISSSKTGQVLGKIPAASENKDIEIKLELVPNGVIGLAVFFYIDGAFAGTAAYGMGAMYDSPKILLPYSDFKPSAFRVYSCYNATSLKADDLHMKDLEVKSIDKYNAAAGGITCFATFLQGFATKNGITRYYNGDGTYKTEDFFIGTTKYLVGEKGAILSNPDYTNGVTTRTLDEVQKGLSAVGVKLGIYHTFNNWEFEGEATKFVFPGMDEVQSLQNFHTYAEYAEATQSTLQLKSYRQGLSVVTEADGNKALYHGVAAKIASDNDVFFDIFSGAPSTYNGYGGVEGGNADCDIYVSVDWKMGGVNISAGSLYEAIFRVPGAGGKSTGASSRTLVYVTTVGALYVGDKADPNKLIGYLSADEYTRVSFETNRASNKFYVYINDVLANPEGDTLFTASDVARMNEHNAKNPNDYTVHNIPINGVRTYNRSDTFTSDNSKGLYIDNIISGYRAAATETTTAVEKVFASDFSANAAESNINLTNNTVTDNVGTGLYNSNMGGSVKPGVIVYVDEDGDPTTAEAIEWRQDAGYVWENETHEGWLNVNYNVPKGKNFSCSMDFKAGPDGFSDITDFFYFRTGGSFYWAINLASDEDGNGIIKYGDVVLATVSKTEYHNIKAEIIANGITGVPAMTVYVDGICVLAGARTTKYSGAVSEFYVDYSRLIGVYRTEANNASLIKPIDIRVKNIVVETIDEYDGGRIGAFEQKLEGFCYLGGFFRYFNGDGTYKTADFTVDGVEYDIGLGGVLIGAVSEGKELAPWAPYEDWTHEPATLLFGSQNGDVLRGATVDNGVVLGGSGAVAARDAGYAPANGAYLYTSYFDAEEGTTSDHNSYVGYALGSHEQNSHVVLDMDLMLDQYECTTDSAHYFIYTTGYNIEGKRTWAEECSALTLTTDGWICDGTTKLVKLSKTEYTRISVVIHTPVVEGGAITKTATADLYANGVLVKGGIALNAKTAKMGEVRFMLALNEDMSVYIKDTYLYASEKPEQFIDAATKALTKDQTATPATTADMKQGFVRENSVARYYDELGFPILGKGFDYEGKNYVANENGAVPCDGVNHLAMIGGVCVGCGTRLADVLLYGNSLVLGSDVKVKFYLDILESKVEGMTYEFGLARDFALELETKQSGAVSDLTPITINGRTLYEFTYAVSGKDIGSTITLKLSSGDEYTYSAAKYAEDVQEMPTNAVYTAELKALAKALADYGKNAAAVLADQPAADIIEEENLFDNVDGIGSGDVVADYNGFVKLKKFTLELKSNIKLKVYFTLDPEGDYAIEEYTVSVRGQVVTPVAVPELGEDVYCIEATLVAADLDEAIEFAIIDMDETGMTLRVSALQYAKIMASSALATDAEKNLMKAIKLYSDAANAYADVDADNRPI